MLSGTHQYTDPSLAKDYSAGNSVQIKQAQHFIDRNGFKIQAPILDVGCGTGEITAYLAKFGRVTGIDISADRIHFASNQYTKMKINFFEADVTKLNEQAAIATKQYRTIVSFNTLHHVPSHLQLTTFQQIKQLLTPNGFAMFLIPGRSPLLHDAIEATTQSEKWQAYFSDFDLSKVRTYQTPEYYKIRCIEAGFYHCDTKTTIVKEKTEKTPADMKNFLRGFLPHLAHLTIKKIDPALQEQFLEDIVKTYFQKTGKTLNEKVRLEITQNKVLAYNSRQAFFIRNQHMLKKRINHSPITSKPRSRL